MRDWFLVNKVSIHFGKDMTKSLVFASKFKKKIIKNLT